MTTMSAPLKLKNIAYPSDIDVLCGRGGGTNNHPGNKKYRKIVREHKDEYESSHNLDKPNIAMRLVLSWRVEHGGRFLKRNTETGLWDDVGNEKAKKKTSQLIREKSNRSASNHGSKSSRSNSSSGICNDFQRSLPKEIDIIDWRKKENPVENMPDREPLLPKLDNSSLSLDYDECSLGSWSANDPLFSDLESISSSPSFFENSSSFNFPSGSGTSKKRSSLSNENDVTKPRSAKREAFYHRHQSAFSSSTISATVASTVTGTLSFPKSPSTATVANVLPDISHSLLSVGQFSDAGDHHYDHGKNRGNEDDDNESFIDRNSNRFNTSDLFQALDEIHSGHTRFDSSIDPAENCAEKKLAVSSPSEATNQLATDRLVSTASPSTLAILNDPRSKIFPWRMHKILNDAAAQNFEHIVSWVDVNGFKVHDRKKFVSEIIPKYFDKPIQYKTLQRQLKLWCFDRVKKGFYKDSYYHKHFIRGNPDECKKMLRVKVKGNKTDTSKTKISPVNSSTSLTDLLGASLTAMNPAA